MQELLYLDTARLGLMSPHARRASIDFARFASEQGASLYLSEFLRRGAESWPKHLRTQYPGLLGWHGVERLRSHLRTLAEAPPDSEVLVAARSAVLMKFAARLLVGPCRNILISDLTWPVYGRILRREQSKSASTITTLPLRQEIMRGQLSEAELVERIAREYVRCNCDGLFLPLVDNLGIHLPLQRIVARIRSEGELRFVVVDGAQAINHVPLVLASDYCDFMVAGCHKWLQAFSPLGLAFYSRPATKAYISDSLKRWTAKGYLDDPLLSFIDEFESGCNGRFGETVAVSPLITANAAVLDASSKDADHSRQVVENRDTLDQIATTAGWRRISPQREFQSRIRLYECEEAGHGHHEPDQLRQSFLEAGVVITAFTRGRVRLSVPETELQDHDAVLLRRAFSSVLS